VYYNNVDITSRITGGSIKDWTITKKFTFTEVAGATLAIGGYNYEANSCSTGGFSIACTSTNPNSMFNDLESDKCQWKALGSATDCSVATLKNEYDDSAWAKPCVNSQGIPLSGVANQPAKLWAADGNFYAAFRYTPTY